MSKTFCLTIPKKNREGGKILEFMKVSGIENNMHKKGHHNFPRQYRKKFVGYFFGVFGSLAILVPGGGHLGSS